MSLSFSDLTKRLFRRFTHKPTPATPIRTRLSVTALEDRTVPSTVTVTALSHATEGGSSGTFRYTRDGDVSQSVGIFVMYTGAATPVSDYTALSSQVHFGANVATVDVTVSAVDDSTSEATEAVVATITSGGGMTIGTPGTATVNIYDNDAVYVSVAKLNDTVEGGAAGAFRLSRIGSLSSAVTANFSIGGTATSGTDYQSIGTSVEFIAGNPTLDIHIDALPDNLVEGNETVTFTVSTGTGYTPSGSMATLTIEDDPPVVSVSATDTFEGSATGGFSFTRSGGDLSEPLTVGYTVGGTATATTDYTALSGTVTFLANETRVEVLVEAEGDNTNDDEETVTVEIDEDDGYEIDGEGGSATVTIADQPLTVSVIVLNDGEEGGGNPVFQFLRSGDLSEELAVAYSVSGTATSGTDYTALGSVTFEEDEDVVYVVAYVNNDSTAEPTETIIVTLDEPPDEDEDGNPDYSLGSEEATAFIRDNDTGRFIWKGGDPGGTTDWSIGANWKYGVVPGATAEVYFDGAEFNSYNCTNVGINLTSVAGIFIINGFSRTLILNNALTVGTYVQGSALLNQPSARDLTVTDAMLWTGGTLDATDSGAKVILDGAAGRFDPPDVGSMSTSSTLRIVNNADLTVLPGTITFAGGLGAYVAARMKWITDKNTNLTFGDGASVVGAKIEIAAGGELSATKKKPDKGGTVITAPILNQGTLSIQDGVHFVVNGRVAGGTTPSLSQTGASPIIAFNCGSAIVAQFGVSITAGSLRITSVKQPNTAAVISGKLKFAGSELTFNGPQVSTDVFGVLRVEGNVDWDSGAYRPRLDTLVTDRWISTEVFTTTVNGVFAPFIAPEVAEGWRVLEGWKGINGAAPTLNGGLAFDYNWELKNAGVPVGGKGAWLEPK